MAKSQSPSQPASLHELILKKTEAALTGIQQSIDALQTELEVFEERRISMSEAIDSIEKQRLQKQEELDRLIKEKKVELENELTKLTLDHAKQKLATFNFVSITRDEFEQYNRLKVEFADAVAAVKTEANKDAFAAANKTIGDKYADEINKLKAEVNTYFSQLQAANARVELLTNQVDTLVEQMNAERDASVKRTTGNNPVFNFPESKK